MVWVGGGVGDCNLHTVATATECNSRLGMLNACIQSRRIDTLAFNAWISECVARIVVDEVCYMGGGLLTNSVVQRQTHQDCQYS